jgi:hypothetical protein
MPAHGTEERCVVSTGQRHTAPVVRGRRLAGAARRAVATALTLIAALTPLLVAGAHPSTAGFTGATSNPASTFTADTLAAPTGLSVGQTCAGGTINAALSWTPTTSTAATGYSWQRTTGGVAGPATAVADRTTSATTDSTALAPSTTYQYQLQATAGSWRSAAAGATLTTTSCAQAQPQVADATSSSTAAAGSLISINRPASAVPGDLLVVFVSDAGTTAVTPDQAGWTLIRTDQSHNAWITQGLWYRWAGAGDPATYSFTKSNPKADMVAAMLRITGANTTNPVDVSAGNSQGGTVSTTITAPSVTTTVANTLLLTFASTTDGNTYTPAAGMTEQVDYTSGRWMSEQVATQAIAAAGATGTRTITINNIGNVYAVASTLAIRR